MKSQTEDRDDRVVLTLEGSLDIQCACELRDVLVQSMQGKPLALALDKVEAADVPALQLFCSLHRTLSGVGLALTIVEEVPASLRQSVAQAGFLREHGCALDLYGTCLWSKGGKFHE